MALIQRLGAAVLLLLAPLVAEAARPDSDLDRLSGTDGFFDRAPQASDGPTFGNDELDCDGNGTNDTPGNTPCPPPNAPPVPLDGGLSLLALAGGGYAAKRLRTRRTNP